jgi:hypothetical protein
MALTISMMVFCVLMPCGLVGGNQRFEGKYCLHLEGFGMMSQPRPPSTNKVVAEDGCLVGYCTI